MKNFILLYLFLILASCIKPEQSSTIPSDSNTFIIEDLPKRDSIKIINDQLTLEFSNKDDKKTFINFLQTEGTKSFTFKSFTDKTDVLKVEPLDNNLSIIEEEDWGEADITPSFKFDSNGKVRVISQFSNLSSPFTTLQLYDLDKTSPLSFANNRATIKLDSSSNSLSILEKWNSFSKKYPATFRAILGDVVGLDALVSKKEDRLSGISPLSPTEISINLTSNSNVSSSPLISILPGIDGLYKIENEKLIFNGDSTAPHLNSVDVKNIGSSDPIIEFSMGKADGILLYKNDDIALIKNKFKDCNIAPIDTMSMFISISDKITKENRLSLINAINSKDILRQLPINGTVINRVIKSSKKPPFIISSTGTNSFDSSLIIIYNKNNRLAKQTAIALKNSLLKNGIKSKVDGNLEDNLYKGRYDIAIGSLNSSLNRYDPKGEFISHLFFNGNIEEDNRIYDGLEKPLFEVSIYLALKEPFIVHSNKIENITKRASLIK